MGLAFGLVGLETGDGDRGCALGDRERAVAQQLDADAGEVGDLASTREGVAHIADIVVAERGIDTQWRLKLVEQLHQVCGAARMGEQVAGDGD